MARSETSWIGRSGGMKILLVGIAIGIAGMAPLLLYILLGPADGNPIGLGLLAVVAVPAGAIVAAVGLAIALAEALGRRGG